MVFLWYRLENKDCKIKGNRNSLLTKDKYKRRIDPGAIGFTSGFSQGNISITVGEQITAEQLREKCIIMRISRHDHVYRHHVSDN